jgi:hypothetical protein
MTFDPGTLGSDLIRRASEPLSVWLGLAADKPQENEPVEAGVFEPLGRDAQLRRMVADGRSAGAF